jgi:hypothetical protein
MYTIVFVHMTIWTGYLTFCLLWHLPICPPFLSTLGCQPQWGLFWCKDMFKMYQCSTLFIFMLRFYDYLFTISHTSLFNPTSPTFFLRVHSLSVHPPSVCLSVCLQVHPLSDCHVCLQVHPLYITETYIGYGMLKPLTSVKVYINVFIK